jgi:hypothetical protein
MKAGIIGAGRIGGGIARQLAGEARPGALIFWPLTRSPVGHALATMLAGHH